MLTTFPPTRVVSILTAAQTSTGSVAPNVTLTASQADNDLWTIMDPTMKQVAAIFANGQPMQVLQDNRDGLGTTHHETGTLWMGTDPTKSVTNADARLHSTENLYAAGPCLFPSIGSPNPMLTGIALARRSGDRIMTPAPFAADPGFVTLFDGVNRATGGCRPPRINRATTIPEDS